MEKIKAFVDFNQINNFHYYQEFEIINELPKIGEIIDDRKVVSINLVQLDCEQPNNDVYNYNYYTVTAIGRDAYYNEDICHYFYCLKRED